MEPRRYSLVTAPPSLRPVAIGARRAPRRAPRARARRANPNFKQTWRKFISAQSFRNKPRVLRAQHTASAVRAAERESPHVSFLVHHVVSSSELL